MPTKTRRRRDPKAWATLGASRDRVRADFATVASHQLRTPISIIRWALDAVLSGRSGSLALKQREYLERAYQQNVFMARIVGDLLRISRIEEGGITVVGEPLNLTALVRTVLRDVAVLAKAYNCTVALRASPNLPPLVGDALKLKAVLAVLVDNAVRYGKRAGRVDIRLAAKGPNVSINVRDRGIGIPTRQQKNIFNKFFRAQNAIRSQTEGLGVELYIARSYVTAMGGTIAFHSQPGVGTTFVVTLPRQPAVGRLVALPGLRWPAGLDDRRTDLPAADRLRREREFVFVTVHELSGPLSVNRWSLEILRRERVGRLNAAQRRLVDQIQRNNDRQLVLVKGLLDVAKLQQGRFSINPQPVILAVALGDVVDSFRAVARVKHITLRWVGPRRLPQVVADAARIGRVFANLISNAIKYTPARGRVTVRAVTVSATRLRALAVKRGLAIRQTEAARYLVFSVQDTGIGIPSEQRRKLFTMFFRAEEVLQRKIEGTGLGLYIARAIVELHHGDIWFESRQNGGSTFSFSLPLPSGG